MLDVTGGADLAVGVGARAGNHGGVVAAGVDQQYRPAGTALQPRGAGQAHAAVAKMNVELAGEVGWSPLPNA